MAFDSDVALIGTGLAPLIAASHLLSQGKSVLILNPDFDFFLEDSELPLDSLLPLKSGKFNHPDETLAELRPFFPGPVESWSDSSNQSASGGNQNYHDPQAPHVRSRSRLWVSDLESEFFDELYVNAEDRGFNPQILDHVRAVGKFPGVSKSAQKAGPEVYRGLSIAKLADVDVFRYRNGVLEFLRERLGSDAVVNDASQIHLMPRGLRFHWKGLPRTARLKDGVIVFWTPKMSSWILSQAKHFDVQPSLPRGVRLWEQWSLVSRTPLDPGVVGFFKNDIAVWADVEGSPDGKDLHQLAVLRAGELLDLNSAGAPIKDMSWASKESLLELSSFCHGFLQWDHFSVRSMKARAVFEWGAQPKPWKLMPSEHAYVISGCDGPLVDVVRNSRIACEDLFGTDA